MGGVALSCGLLTAGTVAIGYDLTKVIDRLFVEHVYNAQGATRP